MGNIYVAGRFEGIIMLGDQPLESAGNSDIFVAEFAASGNLVWARRYGDEQFQSVVDIYVGSRVFIAGEYQGDPTFTTASLVQSNKTGWFIAGLDTGSGQADWVTGEPDNSTSNLTRIGIEAVVETPNTIYAVTTSGTLLSRNYTLRKFGNINGSQSHSEPVGADIAPSALARTSSGELLRLGSFTGSTQVLATGPTLTATGRDAFVAQVTSSLTTQSVTSFGGPGSEHAVGIVELTGGEFVVAGYSNDTFTVGGDTLANQGGNDTILVRLSAQLGILGGAAFGGSGVDRFDAIAAGTDHVVAVGSSGGSLDIGGPLPEGGESDAIVVKVDGASFSPVWARRGGTQLSQSATAVGIDSIDRIAVGGTFTEDLDLGLPLSSAGQDDGFLVQLSPRRPRFSLQEANEGIGRAGLGSHRLWANMKPGWSRSRTDGRSLDQPPTGPRPPRPWTAHDVVCQLDGRVAAEPSSSYRA